jgi:hypothetical protein
MQMANKYMKKSSTSLAIKAMQIRTMLRAGAVAQAVREQSHEALSWNPSVEKKKKRKKEKKLH